MKDGKKLAVAGALIGIAAASLQKRRTVQISAVPGSGPMHFSRSDWKKVALGTKKSYVTKNIPVLSAGVAYFSTLALFPMLAAVVAISALLITPEQLAALVSEAEAYLPNNASGVIGSQLESLVSRRSDNIVAASIALLIALVSASGASKNLIIASNAAYEVEESRGWLAQQLWGIMWTIIGIAFGFLFLALLAVGRGFLEHIGFPGTLIPWVLYGRWLMILLLTILGLSVFYRYGPNRSQVRWQWVSWGATIATLAWMVATFLFFLYVQNFANYSQTYSLFAGIIILMIWMNFSAQVILLGAVINRRLEAAGSAKWDAALRNGS